jgi:serine/threonine protein kinase
MGNQSFEGFEYPVLVAVVKVGGSLETQRTLQALPDRCLPRLLDSGRIQDERDFLVLEKLQPFPSVRFGGEAGRIRVDPATALNTFLNLLESLKGLHFRRLNPLVLCDIKPRSIMLRMPTEDGTIGERAYLERLARGAYEPVFANLSCARDRDMLRAGRGKVKEILGSPLYLPPESMPRLKDRKHVPGQYSTRTDIYSLCMTLYVHLTADRLYGRQGLYSLRGDEFLFQLIALKRRGVSPISEHLLDEAVGRGTGELLEVLEAGLHPDPQQRANPHSLLKLCGRLFGVRETRPPGTGVSSFDSPEVSLRLRQTFFPKLIPARSHYVRG